MAGGDLGPQRATIEAIGQALNDFGGLVVTRLTADLPSALLGSSPPAEAFTAEVETTFGFDVTGTVVINGEIITYSGKTATTLTGLGRDDSVASTHKRGDLVALYTRRRSALELARRAMLVDHAEGVFLDVIGRNYGVPRYLDATDDLYRRMIRGFAYQAGKGSRTAILEFLDLLLDDKKVTGSDGETDDNAPDEFLSGSNPFTSGMVGMRIRLAGDHAQTYRIAEFLTAGKVRLDANGGRFWASAGSFGNASGIAWEILPYDVWFDPFRPCRIQVWIHCAPPTDPRGFAYLQGGETVTPDNLNTVTVAHEIRQVLGVWKWFDPLRQGTNYATDNNFAGKVITLSTPLDKIEDLIVDYGSVTEPTAPTSGIPGSATGVATGQIVAGVHVRNPGTLAEALGYGKQTVTRYPLYIGDRAGPIRALLWLIVAEGMIPELTVRTW